MMNLKIPISGPDFSPELLNHLIDISLWVAILLFRFFIFFDSCTQLPN